MAHFDIPKKTLLVPMHINDKCHYIPFHIFTIKNVAMNIEKNTAFLRVNFHTPLQYGKDIVVPSLEGKLDTLFIKEITLRSEIGGHNLQDVSKSIKDALKDLKTTQNLKEKNPDTKPEDQYLAD